MVLAQQVLRRAYRRTLERRAGRQLLAAPTALDQVLPANAALHYAVRAPVDDLTESFAAGNYFKWRSKKSISAAIALSSQSPL